MADQELSREEAFLKDIFGQVPKIFAEKNFANEEQRLFLEKMRKRKIEGVLKTLTYREREVLKLFYGLGDGHGYNFTEIARIFKMSEVRIRGTKTKAIQKLRHPVRKKMLEEFLPQEKMHSEANLIIDYVNILHEHKDENAPEVLAFMEKHKENKVLMMRIRILKSVFKMKAEKLKEIERRLRDDDTVD